jgi:N-acetylglucosamine-6-phosphate deacetylase
MTARTLTGARIVTPDGIVEGAALTIDGDRIAGLGAVPTGAEAIELDGGWLLPGFIDTQVNGGGDVLFNDAPTIEGIAAIAAAHRRFGTTGLMPTLISDDLSVVDAAIQAVDEAIAAGVPGVLGIHIEGPFLNADKRGIHDASKFRILDETTIDRLARPGRGVRMVTIAPETAPPGSIAALKRRGVVIAAGHSMADYDQTRAALDEGLDGFTHLFNAMTQFEARAPGMVGAALENRQSLFGLIVDGHHVHPAALRVAIAARGVEGAMLVTDAMPPVGGERREFTLMGRTIRMVGGTCRGEDGTLGGSALDMAAAVRNAIAMLGTDLPTASQMSSANPARFLRMAERRGTIAPGMAADLVHLDADLNVVETWIGGVSA